MITTDTGILSILNNILSEPNTMVETSNKYRREINSKVLEIISIEPNKWSRRQNAIIKKVLEISNLLYNNTSLDLLLIEDGIYDLLLEKYKSVNESFPVGAPPIDISGEPKELEVKEDQMIQPMRLISKEDMNTINEMIFPEIIDYNFKMDSYEVPMRLSREYISKRINNVRHSHPELVGTLDKCKYVLNCKAEELGVINDPNVKIVERDWLFPLIGNVIPNMDTKFDMICELKYDGVSIEADVTNVVVSARTRGDTESDEASDLTPILAGYRFPYASIMASEKPIGMKFEAIMTYENLEKFNNLKGYNYKNGRTAIIGLLGSSDAYKYRDLITLVPLQCTVKDSNGEPLDRLVEIEFLNKYYSRNELLRFSVISGNYISILFQIKKYVEDAEFARAYIPFMYDGVVLEFYDANIRKTLGRVNSVNKYSMAVKFDPLKKQTIFREFKFTVGQNGIITPMIYFDPVDFLGTIHPKTTGNSYQRFRNLDLRIGDIIDVTYVNDVITRVTKPDNEHNRINHNKPLLEEEMFPSVCPSCGTSLMFSEDSAKCPNIYCRERNIRRISSTISKLGIKDVSDERMIALGYTTIRELFSAEISSLEKIIGVAIGIKLYNQILAILDTPIEDYNVIGALGFSNVGRRKWKLVFDRLTIEEVIDMCENNKEEYINIMHNIKGMGKLTTNIILSEYPFFKDDIKFILEHFNIIRTYNTLSKNQNKIKIRCTGFRDKLLMQQLIDMGCDADDNASVTKDTNYLLIPTVGYNQGRKMAQAAKYGIPVLPANKIIEKIKSL